MKLRTGIVWEVPSIFWKSAPGCWINYRKRTALHCRRAGKLDQQFDVGRRPQCTTACTRRERTAKLAQIEDRPASTGFHSNFEGMEASAIHPAYTHYTGICGQSSWTRQWVAPLPGGPDSASPSEPLGCQRRGDCIGQGDWAQMHERERHQHEKSRNGQWPSAIPSDVNLFWQLGLTYIGQCTCSVVKRNNPNCQPHKFIRQNYFRRCNQSPGRGLQKAKTRAWSSSLFVD